VRRKPFGLWPCDPERLCRSGEIQYALSLKSPARLKEKERMEKFESWSHVRWERKDHIVFIPKYWSKGVYGKLRAGIGRILRDLCRLKEVKVLEGHARPDHITCAGRFRQRWFVASLISKFCNTIARA
jgi:putative transposase